MAFTQRDNSGSLFKNRNPRDEKSANLTGSAMIDGVEMWISAWTKTDKNGDKWISLSFKKKEAKRDTSNNENREAPRRPQIVSDDEIPF